jgi:2-phosphosulfolactate phosphatase
MPQSRDVQVHLLPGLVPDGRLANSVAVVIDVLRSTTTIIHALAAGCKDVRICAEVAEARAAADEMRAGRVLLGGERGGRPLPGFDLSNSPAELTPSRCKGCTLVLTTTNGTRALLRAAGASLSCGGASGDRSGCGVGADRVLVAGFVNYSAVCEQIRLDGRPVHIICAGLEGDVALEDTLLAGALVDFLTETVEVNLNDAARLAWDCFENHGRLLQGALEVSASGARLRELGYDEDVRTAAMVDRFALVPELRRNPLRIELASVGMVKSHWKR